MTDDWISSSAHSALPAFAIKGGHDVDGSPIYVGRCEHRGEILAAKVIPSKGCAYVPWGGQEHVKYRYEVLKGHGYGWVPQANGGIPENAVVTGYSGNGEPMYIGRGHNCGSLTVGKVHSSHGCLYIPFGGKEVRLNSYEVLVRQQRVHNWPHTSMAFPSIDSIFSDHASYMARAMENTTMASFNRHFPHWQ